MVLGGEEGEKKQKKKKPFKIKPYIYFVDRQTVLLAAHGK